MQDLHENASWCCALTHVGRLVRAAAFGYRAVVSHRTFLHVTPKTMLISISNGLARCDAACLLCWELKTLGAHAYVSACI